MNFVLSKVLLGLLIFLTNVYDICACDLYDIFPKEYNNLNIKRMNSNKDSIYVQNESSCSSKNYSIVKAKLLIEEDLRYRIILNRILSTFLEKDSIKIKEKYDLDNKSKVLSEYSHEENKYFYQLKIFNSNGELLDSLNKLGDFRYELFENTLILIDDKNPIEEDKKIVLCDLNNRSKKYFKTSIFDYTVIGINNNTLFFRLNEDCSLKENVILKNSILKISKDTIMNGSNLLSDYIESFGLKIESNLFNNILFWDERILCANQDGQYGLILFDREHYEFRLQTIKSIIFLKTKNCYILGLEDVKGDGYLLIKIENGKIEKIATLETPLLFHGYTNSTKKYSLRVGSIFKIINHFREYILIRRSTPGLFDKETLEKYFLLNIYTKKVREVTIVDESK